MQHARIDQNAGPRQDPHHRQPQPERYRRGLCNHAAVLSHGHLIYFGSLQDLKGRMKRNHYELDLEGDQKAITKAMQAIKGLSDFKFVNLQAQAPGWNCA